MAIQFLVVDAIHVIYASFSQNVCEATDSAEWHSEPTDFGLLNVMIYDSIEWFYFCVTKFSSVKTDVEYHKREEKDDSLKLPRKSMWSCLKVKCKREEKDMKIKREKRMILLTKLINSSARNIKRSDQL